MLCTLGLGANMGGGDILDWPEARRRKSENPHARWEQIANEFGGEVWPALTPSFHIRPGEAVFTMGSCFARNIEGHLQALGCHVPMLSLSFPTQELYGQPHSAMNRFHPPAFRQCLEWTARIHDRDGQVTWEDCEPLAIRVGKPPEDTFFDMDMAAALPATRARFIERRQHIYDIFSTVFSAACMMMTPGFVEAFRDRSTGLYIHGAPLNKAMLADPDRWAYEVLSYERCLEDMLAAIDVVRARNPAVKVLVTTSPVPLSLTFSGRDIRIANSYSKSLLRTVCDVVAARRPMVDYFPSYETVMLTAPELAWAKDRLHVSQALISHIVSRMTDSYVLDVEASARNYQQALAHLAAGDAEAAARSARTVLAERPDDPGARRALLDALIGQRDWPAAEQEALALHALQPRRPDVLFRLARVLGSQDRSAEAMDWIEKALGLPGVRQRDVESVGKLVGRAAGDKPLVLAARMVELFPRQAEVYPPLVHLLMGQDRLDEAATVIRRGLSLAGPPMALRLAWVNVLTLRGELEQAKREIDQILAARPHHQRAQTVKARIERKLGNRGATTASKRGGPTTPISAAR